MKKLRHAKFKNTGILFELLVRQITSDTLNDAKNSPASDLIRKYFGKSTELSKELQLYQSVIKEKFNSEDKAASFVSLILEARSKLTNSTLNRQKYNLIKEIKEHYVLEDFFMSRVNDYKLLASIYKLFEYNTLDNPAKITECKYTLIEHINKSNSLKKENTTTQTPKDKDLQLLTYKLLVDKFNQKYSNLNTKQKNLLEKYINNVSNTTALKEYIRGEVTLLQEQISVLKENVKDKVTKIKLSEVHGLLSTLSEGKVAKDDDVLTMLQYYELIKELKKVGDK